MFEPSLRVFITIVILLLIYTFRLFLLEQMGFVYLLRRMNLKVRLLLTCALTDSNMMAVFIISHRHFRLSLYLKTQMDYTFS